MSALNSNDHVRANPELQIEYLLAVRDATSREISASQACNFRLRPLVVTFASFLTGTLSEIHNLLALVFDLCEITKFPIGDQRKIERCE